MRDKHSTSKRLLGDRARDVGMDLAARRKLWDINKHSLQFLDAIIASPSHTASTDDTAGSLDVFADGGRWRGSIPVRLAKAGLIAKDGIGYSDRPSRHGGYVARWRAADLAGIQKKRDELRRWLTANTRPAEPVPESLFDLPPLTEVHRGE